MTTSDDSSDAERTAESQDSVKERKPHGIWQSLGRMNLGVTSGSQSQVFGLPLFLMREICSVELLGVQMWIWSELNEPKEGPLCTLGEG